MNNQPIIPKTGDPTIDNMNIMYGIAGAMKEIPVLPSEVPTDSNALTKVEFLDEGGVLTSMENHDYPYRGFPIGEAVEKIDAVKKVCRQIQSGFYHVIVSKSFLGRILALASLPLIGRLLIPVLTYTFHRLIERSRIKPYRYCNAVREIYRAFSQEKQGESLEYRALRLKLRDIECMILEFDNAYRYRAQDILPEFDKKELQNDPINELNRVLNLMISREKREETKDTWRLLQYFVRYYLRFDKQLLSIFVDTIIELDMEKVSLQIDDRYFCAPREDYTFAFMQPPQCFEPENIMIFKKNDLNKQWQELKKAIIKQAVDEQSKIKSLFEQQRQSLIPDKETNAEKDQEFRLKKEQLDEKFKIKQQSLQEEYNSELKKLSGKFLNVEQRAVEENFAKELLKISNKYDHQLKDAEEHFVVSKRALIEE